MMGLKGMGILNYQSSYLSGEKHFINKLKRIKGNKIIFDVGANVGNYSKLILKKIKDVSIYAIEPNSISFMKLDKNILSKQVSKYNFGFSDHSGASLMYDDKNNPGSSHASLHSGVFTDLESKPFTEQTIQLTTIDQFVEDNKISKITLLKIDTEGNEYNVLKGADETLKKGIIDIIQFEFTEMNLFSRHFFNDFYELLIKDYKIYRLLPNSFLEIKNYHPPVCELFAFQNLIAIKRDLDL